MYQLRSILCIILFFLPLLAFPQSVNIDQVVDSSGASGCDTTGENIHLHLEGSSTGLSSGDTVDIQVDHEDGNGWVSVNQALVDSQGSFDTSWVHSWSNDGYKNLYVAVNGPNGSTDTLTHDIRIDDSCSTEIFYVSDSSGFTPCDTVGESIYFYLSGSCTGYASDDTLDLLVDYDDGNGFVFVQELVTGSNGWYSTTWSDSWSVAGSKNMKIKVAPPIGDTAILSRTMNIVDSCSSVSISSVTDSAINASCNLSGDSIYQRVEGSSMGMTSGDSLEIQVSYWNSQPDTFRTTLDSTGTFSYEWYHQWTSSGNKSYSVTVVPDTGMGDSTQHSLTIHDSCGVNVTSSSTYDLNQSNNCLLTGDSVRFNISGQAPGLGLGDSLDLEANYDDGNGLIFVQKVPVDSSGGFTALWKNTWMNSGVKNVDIILTGPGGDQDTVHETLSVGDSCTSVSITSLTDSSGGTCDTTGEAIHFHIEGSSNGLSTGDTIDLTMDPDNSSPTTMETYVGPGGDYSATWSHSWSTSGNKNILVTAQGPNGSMDSSSHQLDVSDSCGMWNIDAFAYDSASNGNCLLTGNSIYLGLQGESSGYSNSDSAALYVDHDDGTGYTYIKDVQLANNSTFNAFWSHTWTSSGPKQVSMALVAPGGETDTIQKTFYLSDSCSSIQGTVYLDQNGDCIYNAGEPLLSNKEVKVTVNNDLLGYAISDSSGIYQTNVGSGLGPYEVSMVDPGSYNTSCPSSGSQQVNSVPASSVNFGLSCPTTADFGFDQSYAYSFRPGFSSPVAISMEGPHLCSDSLECVKAVLPPELSAISPDSAAPPYDAVNGDTVVWNMDTLDVSNFYDPSGLLVHTDSTANVGDTLCVEFLLCASADSNSSNNSIQVCGEVVDSWDPNRKEVQPKGQGPDNLIAQGRRMTYTIQFQNTGTAPAMDIRIEDTLDTEVLDQSSFRFLSASHQVDEIRIEEDSIFEFHFDNIMLPDSGTSQADSKGFVRFSIDQDPNLSAGTVIRNHAAIFFDQNQPVITNNTLNTIEGPNSLERSKDAPSLRVHPNPTDEALLLRSDRKIRGKVLLRDIQGKQVFQREIDGERSRFEIGSLPQGIYFLIVREAGTLQPFRKKIVIE
ncbi:MAG: T9SS type A sorting domain-containing protein [Flavobacteriales bacterium]